MRLYSGLSSTTQNLHVGLRRISVFPGPLDEIAEIWHVLLDRGRPKVRTVFKDAEHVVNVKKWAGSLCLHENDGLVVRHSYTQFEHDVGTVFGEIGDDEIGLDQIADYRRLNHIAALPVRGLNLEILRSWRNDAAQDLREEALIESRIIE